MRLLMSYVQIKSRIQRFIGLLVMFIGKRRTLGPIRSSSVTRNKNTSCITKMVNVIHRVLHGLLGPEIQYPDTFANTFSTIILD